MKAIISAGIGIDKLEVRELPEPPAPTGTEVQVKIHAAGLNHRDLYKINGFLPWERENPIPGCDGSGEVVAVGPDVTRFKVGDKVITSDYAMWYDGLLTPEKEATGLDLCYGIDGCMRELFTIDEKALVPMPKNLTWQEAGVISCTYVTAWNAIINKGEIRPGQTLLLLGTGGVTTAALQFAKAAGARVINTGVNDEVLERAKKLGADEVINFTENPDWHEIVLELTGGKGVDVSVDTVGNAAFDKAVLCTKQNGTLVMVGNVTGANGPFDLTQPIIRCLTIKAFRVGSTEHMEQMVAAVEQNDIHPAIDSTFDLDHVHDAFERLASGEIFGKVCIVFDDAE